MEWVPTVINGPGRINYLQLTNICDREVILRWVTPIGLCMVADTIPQSQGYVSVGSRRYNEWQTLAFKATADRKDVSTETYEGTLVDHRSYHTPRKMGEFNPHPRKIQTAPICRTHRLFDPYWVKFSPFELDDKLRSCAVGRSAHCCRILNMMVLNYAKRTTLKDTTNMLFYESSYSILRSHARRVNVVSRRS